ncbi:ion transporter [Variovorax sp. RKNM96]|uniref:ion transporter n=1 Tax=Variovorax sp. RKNM96 TaxID=2681552 RepID=UPI001AFC9FEB|nr:ion transporter [Variovorax sp. RKNM96]QSI34591.1 ion transporter [Variovorax sp. RKNM96]
MVTDSLTGDARFGKPEEGWRRALFSVIFESESRLGRLFDLILIAVIVTSVVVVILDSVQAIHLRAGHVFGVLEWVFTGLFTLEYIGRLACVKRPLRYATSFYGVIDLLALLPTFLVALAPEFAYLIDVRILRLLRVFRIFKLSRYSVEYRALVSAVAASRRKITVFVGFVMLVVLVMGTLMYVVEGPVHGFTSIPVAIYWAISTMATVGFGDLVPKTDLGRAIASVMMLLGWGVLAVPTGIVTAEMARRGPDDEAVPLTGRGILAMTPPPAAPPRRLTPAARRRALAQHRRGGR